MRLGTHLIGSDAIGHQGGEESKGAEEPCIDPSLIKVALGKEGNPPTLEASTRSLTQLVSEKEDLSFGRETALNSRSNSQYSSLSNSQCSSPRSKPPSTLPRHDAFTIRRRPLLYLAQSIYSLIRGRIARASLTQSMQWLPSSRYRHVEHDFEGDQPISGSSYGQTRESRSLMIEGVRLLKQQFRDEDCSLSLEEKRSYRHQIRLLARGALLRLVEWFTAQGQAFKIYLPPEQIERVPRQLPLSSCGELAQSSLNLQTKLQALSELLNARADASGPIFEAIGQDQELEALVASWSLVAKKGASFGMIPPEVAARAQQISALIEESAVDNTLEAGQLALYLKELTHYRLTSAQGLGGSETRQVLDQYAKSIERSKHEVVAKSAAGGKLRFSTQDAAREKVFLDQAAQREEVPPELSRAQFTENRRAIYFWQNRNFIAEMARIIAPKSEEALSEREQYLLQDLLTYYMMQDCAMESQCISLPFGSLTSYLQSVASSLPLGERELGLLEETLHEQRVDQLLGDLAPKVVVEVENARKEEGKLKVDLTLNFHYLIGAKRRGVDEGALATEASIDPEDPLMQVLGIDQIRLNLGEKIAYTLSIDPKSGVVEQENYKTSRQIQAEEI